jgi:hypothetical protein
MAVRADVYGQRHGHHLRAARERRCGRGSQDLHGRPEASAADDLLPTWWGHSIGHWEGDTLVVDTVGYNDKFWFDSRGTPHTTQLHTIERYTRTNYGTSRQRVHVGRPRCARASRATEVHGPAAPPGSELMEFVCTENNQYGVAADIPNIYREKGYGLEVEPPPARK